MMGIQAEKMTRIYQKLLLTRLKSRRLAGKPITPLFRYSIIPLRRRRRPPACKPYWLEAKQGANCSLRSGGPTPRRERRGANLYIFSWVCQ